METTNRVTGSWSPSLNEGVRLAECTCKHQVRWWHGKPITQCHKCKQWLGVETRDRVWRWRHVDSPHKKKRKRTDPDQIAAGFLQ